MKTIIAGSRKITEYQMVRWAMIDSGLWRQFGESIEVVCGMAAGVDLLGLKFAKCNGLAWKEFPAAWDDRNVPGAVIRTRNDGTKYNVRAGFDRNRQMARYGEALVAIWDGESGGTKHMISEAIRHGLFVYIFDTKTGQATTIDPDAKREDILAKFLQPPQEPDSMPL